MNNIEYVNVYSATKGPLSVLAPQYGGFKRVWTNAGAVQRIDKEIFAQLLYDNGFKYMIDNGMLYIEDEAVMEENGLDPEQLKHYTEKDWRDLMDGATSFADFKKVFDTLSFEQINELVHWAVMNKAIDYNKCSYIKSATGQDVITKIRLAETAEKE